MFENLQQSSKTEQRGGGRRRDFSCDWLLLLARELHEKMNRLLSLLLPCLDALTDDMEVPDCLFLGATPQYEARWSWSGKFSILTEMTSSGASRATALRRLSGHAAGGVPRGGGVERSPWPPRRVQPPLRWGHGRRLDYVNVQGALPGRLAGWRFGNVRDLTRSCGFAAAGLGERGRLRARPDPPNCRRAFLRPFAVSSG